MENPEVPAEVAVSIAEAAGITRIDITEDLPSAADDNTFVNAGRPKSGTNKAWDLSGKYSQRFLIEAKREGWVCT